MVTKEDAGRVIERLQGFLLYEARVSVTHTARGDTVVSQSRHQSQTRDDQGREVRQIESRELVNGGQRSRYRQVEGVEDEAKMEIAGAKFMLMFSNEEDRRAVLDRSDLDHWFVKVEVWTPEVQVRSPSVWLSVVGLPMHLWSEESFHHIVQIWRNLIKVENATVEPQSFERAGFLIETSRLERVEKTVEIVMGDWSGRIRVQEVEVVHSHNLICQCEDTRTMVSSETGHAEYVTLSILSYCYITNI
ncbi:hypothetical protein V6N13_004702 [Hibiscus sabdariffa]